MLSSVRGAQRLTQLIQPFKERGTINWKALNGSLRQKVTVHDVRVSRQRKLSQISLSTLSLSRCSQHSPLFFSTAPICDRFNTIHFRTLTTSSLPPQSFEDLKNQTDEIIVVLSGGGAKAANPIPINREDCINLLGALVKYAKESENEGFAAAQQAHRILSACCENRKSECPAVSVTPDISMFNHVMHAYAVSKGGKPAAETAQALLIQLLQDCQDYAKNSQLDSSFAAPHSSSNVPSFPPLPPPEPNVYSLEYVIQAWVNSNENDARQCAEEVVSIMEDWRNSCDSPGGAYKGWLRTASTLEEVQRVGVAFKMIEETVKPTTKPSVISYNMLLASLDHEEKLDGSGSSARVAEEILQKMIAGGEYPKPNVQSFNSCISAWSRCTNISDAPEQAERLYQALVDRFEETGDADCKPTERTGDVLLSAWSRALHRPEFEKRASQVLQRIKRYVAPGTKCFNTLMEGFVKRGTTEKIYPLFEGMLQKCKEEGKVHLGPNEYTYFCVLRAILGENKPDSAERAEQFLNRIESESDRDNSNIVRPHTFSYNAVINGWSRNVQFHSDPAGKARSAEKAEMILRRMMELYRQKKNVKPDVYAFTGCIKAWSRCSRRHHDAPDHAERLFDEFVELFEETGDYDFKPDDRMAGVAIKAWTIAVKREDSMERATQLLRKSERFLLPNADLFNSILTGYVDRGFGDKAVQLFEWMKEQSSSGKAHLKPNIKTYDTVLKAIASNFGPESAEQAEQLLREIESEFGQPDTSSYNLVLEAWKRTAHSHQYSVDRVKAAEKAEMILRQMIDLYRQKKNVRPNLLSFDICIKIWSSCSRHHHDAPDRAEQLYDELVKLFEETGDSCFKPNKKTVQAAVAAWSKAVDLREDCFTRELQLLKKAERFMYPNN